MIMLGDLAVRHCEKAAARDEAIPWTEPPNPRLLRFARNDRRLRGQGHSRHELVGATPRYLYWWSTSSGGYLSSFLIWKTLTSRLVMSPLSSKLTVPCRVLAFEVWIASRTLPRLTSLPDSATRLTASRMTRAAS